jgi:hypothetical protein
MVILAPVVKECDCIEVLSRVEEFLNGLSVASVHVLIYGHQKPARKFKVLCY